MFRYAVLLYVSKDEDALMVDQKSDNVSGLLPRLAPGHVGAMLTGARLRPSYAATTVRRTGDRTVVEDGAVVDADERLGGLFLIQAEDLDEALDIAKLIPRPWDSIEVRPLWSTLR